MKNMIRENGYIKERVKKGFNITFEKLLKAKIKTSGEFAFSQNGVIKKVKAIDFQP